METRVVIGTGCEVEVATANSILHLMPEFIELDKQGYTPVHSEIEVCAVRDWELEDIWREARIIQERGVAKIQKLLEDNEHGGSFKIDHGEHEFESGDVGFWFIVSELK